MANSNLGDQTFVSFRNPAAGSGGAPEIPQEENAVLRRPGIDGVSVLNLGKACAPFQMVSGVDVGSFNDALVKQVQYNAMSGTLVELTWNGAAYLGGVNCRFVVLRVSGIEIIRCAIAVGGLLGVSTGSRYWVRAVWDLIATDIG